MLFDTHCHIYDSQYEEDLEVIIKKSLDNGISKMLVPSDSLFNAYKCIELASRYEFIYASIGVHPSEVFDLNIEETISTLLTLIKENHKVKAVGEIGLDYYWYKDDESKELQKRWFKAQISLANEVRLPIIVHCRDAVEDTLKILEEIKPQYGCVFHCFSGSIETMNECLKRGYYIGLDGPVTYKNAVLPKLIASKVPLNRLFLETDSPYLTPTPNRGKRNDPSNLIYIAREIASIKGISFDEVALTTTKNALEFFKIGEDE